MADSFSFVATDGATTITDNQLSLPRGVDPYRRFWDHRLSIYIGAGYARGTVAGFREAEHDDSLKNCLSPELNNEGQTGRHVGNTMGVVNLIFSAMELGINVVTGDEGIWNTLAGRMRSNSWQGRLSVLRRRRGYTSRSMKRTMLDGEV